MTRPASIARKPVTPLAYSVPDAARAIGISPSTMWLMVKDGKVTTFKLGHRTLITADELRALISRAQDNQPNPA